MRKQQAILLSRAGLSVKDKKIGKILGFCGVAWRSSKATECFAHNGAGWENKCRLICSSDTFLQLIDALERDTGCIRFWEEQVHSAFIYAGNEPESLLKLAQRLIGDNG